MTVSAVQLRNVFNVNDVKLAQAYPKFDATGVNAVKERELHPAVCSTELGKTHLANRLDLLC